MVGSFILNFDFSELFRDDQCLSDRRESDKDMSKVFGTVEQCVRKIKNPSFTKIYYFYTGMRCRKFRKLPREVRNWSNLTKSKE